METAYLALVLIAFFGFMVAVAYGSRMTGPDFRTRSGDRRQDGGAAAD